MAGLRRIGLLFFRILLLLFFIILLFYNFDEEYGLVESFVRILCRACIGLGG